MTIRDKYPKLKDKKFVRNMICKTVYGSMALENQKVSMRKIKKLYKEVRDENSGKENI